VNLNRIIFPYLFFISLAALAMGILNCFHTFGLPAATPVLLNLSIIIFSIGAVWHYFKAPAVSLAVGVLVGGVLQFLVQVPSLVQKGMRFSFGISFNHPGIRNVAQLMIPRFFGIGIGQINFFVDTYFVLAKGMPQGSLAALSVADRVMELVLGGYAIAVATAILPMMSHQAAANDFESLKKTLAFSVRIVAFITIPAALGLMILREPIIRVLFQHGQFIAASTRLTAQCLLYYAVGLPALASVKLIVPAFYSTRDTKTPVIIASISLVLNVVLNIIFLKFLFARGTERRSGARHRPGHILRFLRTLIIFRLRYGPLGTVQSCVPFQRFPLRGHHGCSLLVRELLHRFYDPLALPRATSCFCRPDHRSNGPLPRSRLAPPLPRNRGRSTGLPPGARLVPVPVTDTRGADGDFVNHIVVFDSRAR